MRAAVVAHGRHGRRPTHVESPGPPGRRSGRPRHRGADSRLVAARQHRVRRDGVGLLAPGPHPTLKLGAAPDPIGLHQRDRPLGNGLSRTRRTRRPSSKERAPHASSQRRPLSSPLIAIASHRGRPEPRRRRRSISNRAVAPSLRPSSTEASQALLAPLESRKSGEASSILGGPSTRGRPYRVAPSFIA